MHHALLIVNTHSRNGKTEALDEAIQVLETGGIDVSVRESESEEQMVSLIENYSENNGVIIVAGGDGTISSALNAIFTHKRTLAILPMGTANDFARSIGVSQDLLEAAQVIVDGKREHISLGKVNEQLFVNVAHVGLGVAVTHELTSKSKKYFGVFAYFAAFIKALKRNKSFKVHITTESWEYSGKAIHLAIGNGRYYGGGNIVAEESTLLDGKLNLFFIRPQRWWQLLLLGRSLRKGTLKQAERAICKTAKRFNIQTSKAKELEADGEVKTTTPAIFEVIPNAIEVIVGDIPTSKSEQV